MRRVILVTMTAGLLMTSATAGDPPKVSDEARAELLVLKNRLTAAEVERLVADRHLTDANDALAKAVERLVPKCGRFDEAFKCVEAKEKDAKK